jgi:hypothetical protein
MSVPESRPRASFRLGSPEVLVLALFVAALQLWAGPRYGLFRDEYYYLACADHLAWGYVDQPPLSIAVLAGVRALLGDGIFAIRLVPALLHGILILATARLAREMSGGRAAQGLAGLAVAIVPQLLGLFGYYSMNAFDLLFWSLGFWLLIRLVASSEPRLWLAFGVLFGVGLLNKVSLLLFAGGLAVAVVATPLRRHLRSWQLWAGAGIALALFAPHIVWQIRNGWPTLEFMANATRYKNAPMAPLEFFAAQVRENHPFTAPLWIGGLLWLLVGREGKRFRALGFLFLTVLGVMLATRSKPYYLAGAFPVLFAAGAVALERFSAARRWRWPIPAAAAVLLAGGALVAPLAIPILPVERLVAYQRALGAAPKAAENNALGALSQHFADRFGWPEMTAAVARAWSSLSPEERRDAMIVGSNYGEASAINYFGRELGLPLAVSQHNSFYLWGPGRRDAPSVVILVGFDAEDVADTFERVDEAGRIEAPYAMPYETRRPILIGRGFKLPLAEAWRRGKHFV